MRLGLASAVIALVGSLAAACSSSEISAEDYDASCSASSDCVTATFGDVCAVNCNPNGAIRASEQARYMDDFHAKAVDCPQVFYDHDPCDGLYRTVVAQCLAGRCEAVDVTDMQSDAGADGGP